MKQIFKVICLLMSFLSVLILGGCQTSGSVHVSAVYGGYGYPYYNYGYDGCCYGSPNRPDRPDRPDRPIKPERPVKLPARSRPSGGMGRPARMPTGRRR